MKKAGQGQIEIALGTTGALASRGTARVHVYAVRGAANTGSPRPLASAVPQMIPKDEVPFWTPEWRELLREGRDEIARGETVEFGGFKDLATWLLTPGDEE